TLSTIERALYKSGMKDVMGKGVAALTTELAEI
ncbi:hypothetical protein SAMN02194393_05517, partial [Maledivibacter halophilus]